jgi:hypothetical protein
VRWRPQSFVARHWISGLLSAVVISTGAGAAELASLAMEDHAIVIAVRGELVRGDTDAAEGMIKTANDRGRLISAIQLDSAGGSLAEAIAFSGLIRRAKLSTIVAAGSRCTSACFIVFAAGIEKFASHDAAIGVHGVSDRHGQETAQTEAATLAMARIASGFGVPYDIIVQMVTTHPRDMAWLTPEDLRGMGVVMTDRAGRRASPALTDNHRSTDLDAPSSDTASDRTVTEP